MHRSLVVQLLIAAVLTLGGSPLLGATIHDLPNPLDASGAPQASALACGAPGFHPIVREGVTADDLEAAGLSGIPIAPSQDTTIEAANGTSITLPAGMWTPARAGDFIFVDDGESTTAISLVTGDSWPFNASTSESSAQGSGFSYTMVGPWLVGPANDTATDFWVINNDTGASLLTSEVFGAPFTEPRDPAGLLTGVVSDSASAVIPFVGAGSVDAEAATLVLPSGTPDDAWALDTADADAGSSLTISADGSRLVLVDSTGEIRVLDGFTGEQIASYPVPEPDPMTRAIGLVESGTTLLLRDAQSVWTIDIDTGETATLTDSGDTVSSVAFDPTTGTALASIEDGPDSRTVWLDPASGEVTDRALEDTEGLPRPQQGWALLQMRNGEASYALLDMATGEIATEPIQVPSSAPPASPFQTVPEDGIWVVPGEPGHLLVFDGPRGRSFELPPLPEEIWAGWGGPSHGVSPNGECILYLLLGSGFEEPPGVTWIAPLAPGSEWTMVPFEINGWLEVPED